MLDPTVIALLALICTITLTVVSVVTITGNKKSAHDAHDEKTSDQLMAVQRSVDKMSVQTSEIHSDVSDIKAEVRSHGKQINDLHSEIVQTRTTAGEALTSAKAAHERMDYAGIPSAYSARMATGRDPSDDPA